MLIKVKQGFMAMVLIVALLSLIGCQGKTTANNADTGKKEELISISTQELQDKIGQTDWVIVDTRINDAYNGWQLEGVKRGGHVKGAVDFAANWLQVEDKDKEQKLDKVLKDKGITAQKNVVLYDASGNDAKEVAQYLKSKGFNQLYLYNVKEWADKDLPMESYTNYQMIVPAVWVNDMIKTNNNGKPYKIFEVSWGEKSEDYLKGHIPGAVHINTDEVEEPPIWNRLSDQKLEQFAINNGITTDTSVVLYGADPMGSYRVAAILKYMGVKDVWVLNGGFPAWERAGYEQETKVNDKKPGTSFGTTVPANKNYIVDLPEAKQILADKAGSRLVDIRSWDEYIGKTPGYSDITAKGRPAGAVWGHAGSDPNHLEDFRNIDNTMRNANEILAMWKEWDITPDQKMAFYCGTGWRAAEVLIYADVMGLENIALYDGGWYEWSANQTNPVEIGEPKR